MIFVCVLFLFMVILKNVFMSFNETKLFYFVGFCVSSLILICVIVAHCDDISIIITADEKIKVCQNSIEEVDRQMKDLNISNVSLMNNDSPYRTLIELRGNMIKCLGNAKNEVVDAKRRIISRKLGINRHVVYFFGEGDLTIGDNNNDKRHTLDKITK